MGLLDLLFSAGTCNSFSIGDFVRIKLTREEGTITTAFSDNTLKYMRMERQDIVKKMN